MPKWRKWRIIWDRHCLLLVLSSAGRLRQKPGRNLQHLKKLRNAPILVELDATPLKAKKKKYVKGHEDTGGELPTTFNYSDTFEEQWNEMYDAYEEAKKTGLAMWFTAYHPSKKNANFYIVEPGSIPAPEYGVGNVLQVTISNTLVDLPEASTAIKPTEPVAAE